MPKRSNDFQRLVYLVRLNLAEGAKVTESKMLRDRVSRRYREVDVVIEGKVGLHPVIVSIECRDHRRVADVTWVDAMKTKHDRLETNALLLASRRGFTREAKDIARSYGIEVFALEDVDNSNLSAILGPNGSLWIKSASTTIEKVRAKVAAVTGLTAEIVVTSPDNLVYAEDGSELGEIREVIEKMVKAPRTREYLLSEGREEHKWFELIWEDPKISDCRSLYMKKLEPTAIRKIEFIRVSGTCSIEIARFALRHGRLGDTQVAWGKTVLRGRDTMAVATLMPQGGAKLSINISGAV